MRPGEKGGDGRNYRGEKGGDGRNYRGEKGGDGRNYTGEKGGDGRNTRKMVGMGEGKGRDVGRVK